MKVILTGATGYIGSELLEQAVAHPGISSLICITRRALPEAVAWNPKLKVILHSDFSTYPPELLAELQGSQACIWALGSPALKTSDLELRRSIEIRFTHIAAKEFSKAIAPKLDGCATSFRFLYLSGKIIKGEVENGLLEIQTTSKNFEVSIVRPGGVLVKDNMTPDMMLRALPLIRIEELAAAMVDEVLGVSRELER
ncbi:hypothetical protein BJ878DRAFT_478966 [Calycina marina]|uniref:NAD(P)-binding domain-containing protein n=1 Tax=Calycina marina TaxID=1763456 RepID=A0A9P7Z5H8_9HELO|nr:hypothetical protein BJ878DRAFT_478966 [Calycina marina]